MSFRDTRRRAALITTFAWLGLCGAAQAADFAQPPTSPEGTGSIPTETAIGDFNGDGKKDLATVNAGDDNVSILLGDGTGDFNSAGVTDDVSEIPNSITAADFNGDNKLDLATAGAGTLSGGDDLRVLLGDGTGHFTLKPKIALGGTPLDVVSGDFNGDNKPDLATADKDASSITILLGDGAGNFTKPGTSPESTSGRPYDLAVGDFNGDTKLDLAATFDTNTTFGVAILLGSGTGDFTAAATSPELVTDFPSGIVSADLNGDNKSDLAVSSGAADKVDVLLGAGTGNFTAAPTSPEATADGASGVTAADFDGDGKMDLATSNFEFDHVNSVPKQGSATILMGVGGGNFTEAPTSPEQASDGANAIATSDFDGDTYPDLVVTNYWGGSDTILLNLRDDPPTAVNDSKNLTEDDGATTIDVLGNDTDSDGGPKTILSKTNGTRGDVAITNSGTDLTYTPHANDCGTDSFTYTLNGGSSATVSISIACVDDPPTAVNDSKNLTEDDPATTIDVLGNDTDIDGGPKLVAGVTGGPNNTIAITNSGADVTYKPAADFCGSDSFTYQLNGGSSGTVNVSVACVDDAPVAVNDTKTLNQDAAGPTTIDVLGNDTDVDAGPKSVSSKTNGAHGQVAITNSGADVTYTADTDFCGPDSFTYTLNGGSTATVNVTVTCVNAAPRNVSAGSSYTISEGDPIHLQGSATDRENDPLTYTWDIDGDGQYDDATGASPTISSADLVSLGISDGPSTHQIGLRVSDGALQTTATPVTLTLRNAAPTLQITGSADGLSDKTFDFTLTATDPSPADESGQFDYAIDDGADGTVEENQSGPSSIDISRAISERGTFTLAAIATDRDGAQSAPSTISLRLASLRKACKAEPAKLLFGSSAADKLKGTKGNDLIATAAGDDTIKSGAGDDCVKAGKGDDKIKAGPGEDAAFGQVGNDVIDISKRGDGLAICGPGKDTAIVGRGDNTKGCERIRQR